SSLGCSLLGGRMHSGSRLGAWAESLGFTGSVSFSCANAPPQANCSVSPASVNFQGPGNMSLAVTVATTAHSLAPSDRWKFPGWPSGLWEWFAAGLVLVLLECRAVAEAGCGGGSSSTTPPVSRATGTPAGTYTGTVSATAQDTTQSLNSH